MPINQVILLVALGFLAGAGAGWFLRGHLYRDRPSPDQVREYMRGVVNAETLEYQQHKKSLDLLRAKRRSMRPEHNPNPHARVYRLRRRRRPVQPRQDQGYDSDAPT